MKEQYDTTIMAKGKQIGFYFCNKLLDYMESSSVDKSKRILKRSFLKSIYSWWLMSVMTKCLFRKIYQFDRRY